uniref:Uncharacterized protein n=1 Tax=Grammatophora oceanica TaxID=210454 RepID=A0A7S1VNM4_9STRA|mmetsp:Transcript_50275/g.75076  ORF Transcript_50275/g.75076 Transcript_50275/m.75076 type:complete len:281 (+) Transcript_50275:124-966(+)
MDREDRRSNQSTPVQSPGSWRSRRKLRKKSSKVTFRSPNLAQLPYHRNDTSSPPNASRRSEKVSSEDTFSPRGVADMDGMLQQAVRKHVRFQPRDITGRSSDTFIANDLVPSSAMTVEDKRRIWWQNSDYQIFKQTGRLIAREIQRRQDVRQTSSPNSYMSIMARTYSACHQPNLRDDESPICSRDKRTLQQWTEVGMCRRGLEKWSIPQMTRDRFKRKAMVIHTVLDLQKRLRASRSRLNFPNQHGGEELMRVASERLTKPARLFARAMGEADEVSVSV